LAVLQCLSRGVRVDRDVALGIDKMRAMRGENSPRRVGRVGRLSHPNTERKSCLVALLRRGEEGVPGPLVRERLVRWRSRWIHFGELDPRVLLEQVNTPAGSLHLSAGGRRYTQPVTILFPKVLD